MKKNGFTLIEMLIMIVVISILALIVIPRLLDAGRKVKEDQLRLRLQIIHAGIAQFKDDCGEYPASLMWLLEKPRVWKSDGTQSHPLPGWKGPYLRGSVLPIDPFTGKTDWSYDNMKGDVHSACDLTAFDGTAYSSW